MKKKEKVLVEESTSKKSRKGLIVVFSVVLLLIVIAIVSVVLLRVQATKEAEEEALIVKQEETSGYVLDNYLVALQTFNTDALLDKSLVMDSSVAMESEFINSSESMEKYIKWVCSNTSFSGLNYTDRVSDIGTPSVTVDFTVSSIDFDAVRSSLDSDKVQSILLELGYSSSDIAISYKVQEVFIEYMLTLDEVPMIDTQLSFDLVQTSEPSLEGTIVNSRYVIESDKVLDSLLFSSVFMHGLQDSFSKAVVGWTGLKPETYIDQEEQENPEYADWLSKLNVEIEKYPTWSNNSKCLYEPYYLRDGSNKIVKDENGNKVVNFYVLFEPNSSGKKVKDSSSPYKYKYIPEPEHTIMVDVEKVRQVEDVWVDGSVFKYNFAGYSYVMDNNLSIRAGDGSAENPASEDTDVFSKAVTQGGVFDISISLDKAYIGSDAIQYAIDHSEKNRGLDATSVVKIVVCEFNVTNLSDSVITFTPDMVLVDSTGSKLSRTGTLYGLTESYTIQSGETVLVQDWASSTDMQRYQVAWGRSFDTSIPLQYFNVIK